MTPIIPEQVLRAATEDAAAYMRHVSAQNERLNNRFADAVKARNNAVDALDAVVKSLIPDGMRTPSRMLVMSEPWPQVARALWPDSEGAAK